MNGEKLDIVLQSFRVPAKRSKEEAWEHLMTKLEEKEPRVRKLQHLNWLIGAVAAVAVFGLIMYVGMFNTGKYSPDYLTEVHQTDTLVLPDNSTIALNSNSLVRYSFNKFTRERAVYLKGEAFFEVEKGKKFNVEFEGGNLSVLGTAFDVIAYSDNYIQVDCVHGSVEVELNSQKILLSGGYGLKCYNGDIDGPYQINSQYIADRMNGLFYWKKVSVTELLYIISMRFGYNLVMSEGLEGQSFSGKIDLNNLKDCLNIVSYAMDLRYTIEEKTQTIKVNAK